MHILITKHVFCALPSQQAAVNSLFVLQCLFQVVLVLRGLVNLLLHLLQLRGQLLVQVCCAGHLGGKGCIYCLAGSLTCGHTLLQHLLHGLAQPGWVGW